MKDNRFFTSIYSEKTKRWINFYAFQEDNCYKLFSDFVIEDDGFPGLFEEKLPLEKFNSLSIFEKFVRNYLKEIEEYPELFSRANALTKKVSFMLGGNLCVIKNPFMEMISSLTDNPDEEDLGLCNYTLFYQNSKSAASLDDAKLIENLDRLSEELADADVLKTFSFEHLCSRFFENLEPYDWILNTTLAIQNRSEIFYNAGINYFNTQLDQSYDLDGKFFEENSISECIRFRDFSHTERKKVFYELVADFADIFSDEHTLENFSVKNRLDEELSLKLLDRSGYLVSIMNSCIDYRETQKNFVKEFNRTHDLRDFYFETEQNLIKDLYQQNNKLFTLKKGFNSLCNSLFKPILKQLQQDRITLKNQYDFLINPERIENFKRMTGAYSHGA